MKKGTSVLELTMPTRTFCASAPLQNADTPIAAVKHARIQSLKGIVRLPCRCNRQVFLVLNLRMGYSSCKDWVRVTFFSKPISLRTRQPTESCHDRCGACDTGSLSKGHHQ